EQHLIELDPAPGRGVEPIDLQALPRLDTILLAAGGHNRVHAALSVLCRLRSTRGAPRRWSGVAVVPATPWRAEAQERNGRSTPARAAFINRRHNLIGPGVAASTAHLERLERTEIALR